MAEQEKNVDNNKADQDYNLTAEESIRMPRLFNALNKVLLRDPNDDTERRPAFYKYDKYKITKYLADPYLNEKHLRNAVRYIYGASPHFRRLIQYFVGLTDLAYIVSPHNIDPKNANARTTNINYRRVLQMLSSMSIKTQVPQILTTCLREDVYYATLWVTSDNITIQQLPSDFCRLSTIEKNVLNVDFNFQYFDTRKGMLKFYPSEFTEKYEEYKKDKKRRWISLDSPTSFAIKCNMDILTYAIPPFAGILREIYDIEDYKRMKLDRTELENYAMLAMTLPMQDDGSWGIDLAKAKEFWRNLDSVLPDLVGSVLTPMKIDKIDFERSSTADNNTISDAEQNLFTAAGVSSLLFNNEKASANALLLSIKADQAMTYGIVKNVEAAINRFLQHQKYGKNFKITFLDTSPYNRKEMSEAYLKAASYGLPTISMYAATQGLGQAELDAMSFLETDVLELQELFTPIRNSTQMSSDEIEKKGATDEGGAPTKEVGDITESGEANQENA